jgi:hypothetical protein
VKVYVIEYKGGNFITAAKSKDEALARFFHNILNGKIKFEDLGNIIILFDDGDQYGFRTVPLLWKLGVIDKKTAIANVMLCTNTSKKEAEKILIESAKEDSRLIPYIIKMRGEPPAKKEVR